MSTPPEAWRRWARATSACARCWPNGCRDRDGGPFTRQNVLLANGSSNALSLCAAALLDPGDGVIVESLSYPFMLKYLAGRGRRHPDRPHR